jgi:hypothetical protein
MDATVFPQGNGFWRVNASPSMRDLGEITRAADGAFTVEPDEASDLVGVPTGPYASLDDALSAIAAHLQGQCRLVRKRSPW